MACRVLWHVPSPKRIHSSGVCVRGRVHFNPRAFCPGRGAGVGARRLVRGMFSGGGSGEGSQGDHGGGPS